MASYNIAYVLTPDDTVVEKSYDSVHNPDHPLQLSPTQLRDWSLIMGRGVGATKYEGGGDQVLPLQKVGAEQVVAMLKEGHKQVGVFCTQ